MIQVVTRFKSVNLPKYLKGIVLATCLSLCFVSVTVHAQTGLLENYRFEDGGYTLAGIFVHHEDHPLQKKIGEFYTDDIPVLNSIKKAWVFSKPQYQHACGYHYNILVLKNGIQVNSFALNLECNELATDDGSRYFDLKKLDAFATKLKRLKRDEREFASIVEARDYLKRTSTSKDFIYAWPPRWTVYEGEFRFKVSCPPALGKDCYMMAKSTQLENGLRAAISARYPGEVFEVKANGGSSEGDAYVSVKCNKTLEEKFDLYDRWNRTGFGKWEPYHLTLTTYLRSGN